MNNNNLIKVNNNLDSVIEIDITGKGAKPRTITIIN